MQNTTYHVWYSKIIWIINQIIIMIWPVYGELHVTDACLWLLTLSLYPPPQSTFCHHLQCSHHQSHLQQLAMTIVNGRFHTRLALHMEIIIWFSLTARNYEFDLIKILQKLAACGKSKINCKNAALIWCYKMWRKSSRPKLTWENYENIKIH